MKLRVNQLLEREFKLSPPEGFDCSANNFKSLFAGAGITMVEDWHTLQERDYWDGADFQLARRNMTCMIAETGGQAKIELKMPLQEATYLYREFELIGEGPALEFQDPLLWNAPGLAQVRDQLANDGVFESFIQTLDVVARSRTRRGYYWLTSDAICDQNDFFAHDTVFTLDVVEGQASGLRSPRYDEIEIEVCPWAEALSAICERAVTLLLDHGFQKHSTSKYRGICQNGGVI